MSWSDLEEDEEVLFLCVAEDLWFQVFQDGHTEVDLQQGRTSQSTPKWSVVKQ